MNKWAHFESVYWDSRFKHNNKKQTKQQQKQLHDACVREHDCYVPSWCGVDMDCVWCAQNNLGTRFCAWKALLLLWLLIIKTTAPVPIQHVSITAYCGGKSPGLASTVTENISGVCRGDESEPTTGHYLLQAGVASDPSGDSEEVGHVRETALLRLHLRQWWSDNFWAYIYKELIDPLIACRP